MSEMIERVAAEIAGYLTPMIIDKVWDNQLDEDKEHYRAMARAAIEAMRELPSEPGPRYTAGEYSRRNIAAMVDDALGKVDA